VRTSPGTADQLTQACAGAVTTGLDEITTRSMPHRSSVIRQQMRDTSVSTGVRKELGELF
jgi:hypothetical protein